MCSVFNNKNIAARLNDSLADRLTGLGIDPSARDLDLNQATAALVATLVNPLDQHGFHTYVTNLVQVLLADSGELPQDYRMERKLAERASAQWRNGRLVHWGGWSETDNSRFKLTATDGLATAYQAVTGYQTIQRVTKHCNKNGVVSLNIRRPDCTPVNGLDIDTIKLLRRYIRECQNDEAVRSIVISGGDGVFVGGGDPDVVANRHEVRSTFTTFMRELNKLFKELQMSEKPVVAAIDGPAVGAGLSLALHAHACVASHDAWFQAPQFGVGLVSGASALARVIGPRRTLEMMLSGDRVPVVKFQEWTKEFGQRKKLIAAVAKSPQSVASELAQRMVKNDGSYRYDWDTAAEAGYRELASIVQINPVDFNSTRLDPRIHLRASGENSRLIALLLKAHQENELATLRLWHATVAGLGIYFRQATAEEVLLDSTK